ncbi:hypothetical protein DL96DRAFT_1625926 [Flagelloscypha sp. PMI_526]|nr:hypothetical protein DL96DRAFT_1625926 [Flagelloscypha sp. PMI_526]
MAFKGCDPPHNRWLSITENRNMVKWFKTIRCWTWPAFKLILAHSTLYPLFHELTVRPHLLREDLEYLSDGLTKRSKMVVNGFFAIIGFTWSIHATPSKADIVLPFLFLLWCIINRAYYEGLPVHEFQYRVQVSTPALVAVLYAIPEFYQVTFIIYHIVQYSGWAGLAILGSMVLFKTILHCVVFTRGKNPQRVLPC